MDNRDKLYIDGAWVPSTGSGTIDVINSTTEEVMGRIPEGTPADVDRAVAAAKAAFPAWAATPIEERRKLVTEMAEVIEANVGELARLLTSEQASRLRMPRAKSWAWPPSSAISLRSTCRCG